ncbi:MAG: AAA family ATPase, partial [Acidobacteria bacterium]|nr:AAA family ATPase [Acidobacteriota bacterium]
MYTISILSQKGGSGKTTLALNLAGAVEAARLVPVVADIDQQGSCKYWYDRR